jgi:hypothetical protein
LAARVVIVRIPETLVSGTVVPRRERPSWDIQKLVPKNAPFCSAAVGADCVCPFLLIGYARVSTTEQNPAYQVDALARGGVAEGDIYVGHRQRGPRPPGPSSTSC